MGRNFTQFSHQESLPTTNSGEPSDQSKRVFLARVAQVSAGAALGAHLATPTVAQETKSVSDAVGLRVYASLAEMIDDAASAHGHYATTLGFHAPGDGGGAQYALRDDYPSPPDGYGDHKTANGLTAVLQHSGDVRGEQFGATQGREVSANLNAAMAFLVAWQDAHETEPSIKLSHASACTIQDQVRLSRPDKSRVRNCNLDFSQSALTVVPGGTLDAKTPAVRVSLRGYQHMGWLDCSRLSSGYLFRAMSGSTMVEPGTARFLGYGMKVTGASGNFILIRPMANELEPRDPLYNDESNYVADAFVADDGDFSIFEGSFKWARRTCYLTPDANKVRFSACHFVNGNVNAPKQTAARQDPALVVSDARRTNFFYDTYFDNGHIRDNTNNLQISGGNYVDNRRADVRQPLIRVIATEENQAETNFRLDGLAASVGFFPGKKGHSWKGDHDKKANKSIWLDQVKASHVSQVVGRLYRMFPGGDDADEIIQKLWGNITTLWRNGTGGSVEMTADPENSEIRFAAETLRHAGNNQGKARLFVGTGAAGLSSNDGGLALLHEPGRTVNVGELPRSASGLTTGDLWIDGDVLRVVG